MPDKKSIEGIEEIGKDKEQIAVLTNNDRYSVFTVGDTHIKFKTSPYLLHYDSIITWNDGYIECMASYSTMKNPVEEYIDLRFVADRLRLPKNFFSNIEEVRIQ